MKSFGITIKKMIVVLAAVALWQGLYAFFPINPHLIPPPLDIATSFADSLKTGEIIEHLLVSLQRVIVGFLIAAIVAIPSALFLGYHKKINALIEPLIEVLRPIPPIAWIPIAILLFGLGNDSAYFIIFLGAFFPIFTNTLFGATSLPQIYKNTALSFEISEFSFFKDILFRFSLPYIFTGLKIGIGMAWMSVIAAELIGAQSGLGYFIQMNRVVSQVDKIIVGMIMIGIAGYMLNASLSYAEKIALPWKRD